ncbi:hypothetical protein GCM10010430_34390 [Kitasatospora cystarginea]|uniref:Integral membrane protein n=1 Tax=Kitasatospora cystarginea TaxID=58350 RepID=A0ABN3E589_9ACTN
MKSSTRPRRRSPRNTAARLRAAAAGTAPELPKPPVPVLVVAVVVVLGVVATVLQALQLPATAHNRSGTEAVHRFVDFFFGVLTLMALSGSVTLGLLAAERRLMTPRHRVVVQALHRAVSTAAVVTLVIHIGNKVAEGHAAPAAAVMPFASGTSFAVGVGTIAGELLVLAAVTGALRGHFANNPRLTRLWRPLHWVAYASWPLALAHGLEAGRPAKGWVVWSYGVNMAVVALVLLIKFLHGAGRNTTGVSANRRLMAVDLIGPGEEAGYPPLGDQLPVFGESSALLALDVELPDAQPEVAPEPVAAATVSAQLPVDAAAGQWDTGELNALLDAGRQQYLAEQAAFPQQQQPQYQPQFTTVAWDTGELNAMIDAGRQQYLAEQMAFQQQQQQQQAEYTQQLYAQQYPSQAFTGQPGYPQVPDAGPRFPSAVASWPTPGHWSQPTPGYWSQPTQPQSSGYTVDSWQNR